jgi:hypothetical protein
MTPSEQCKKAGLKSLAELSQITDTSVQTLINWHRDKPALFDAVLIGSAKKQTKPTEAIAVCKLCGQDLPLS